ncbi:oligosaccharide flippase family protein [uncultured Bacteroides sp.]|uniref:lipopolysaccharide biosynthesis protein n=1 Tax=uncultured Bacteroides sp. TaxID=162156 RepID=UPI0026301495|nr:oligosaccharide flippase family protein [uncultured Bacteroides sp.]
MKKINSDFISGFVKRGGFSVFFSTALVKICAALLSIIVVQLLPKDDYGVLSYVLSIYAIAIVVAGLGGNYSLLRFGSIVGSFLKKKQYYYYTQKVGIKYTSIVVAIIIVYSFFLPEGMKVARPIIIYMCLGLYSFYILETMRSYFRIVNLNRVYSQINVYNSVILLFLTVSLTSFFKSYGYITALVLAPLLTYFCFKKKIPYVQFNNRIELSKKEYWGYGIHTSISAIANQIIFSIAPLLLGILNEPESNIANFRVATIIPFNLLTLPGILMISDFSYLSRNYKDKKCLKSYYCNYLKVVVPVSFILFLLLIIYGDFVVENLFGAQYNDCIYMYKMFMVATFVTYIFRNPLGNILLAVGKAKWNGYNTYIFCLLYIIFSFIFYQYWGVLAIVYCLCATFILSGFVSLYLFYYYIKSLK